MSSGLYAIMGRRRGVLPLWRGFLLVLGFFGVSFGAVAQGTDGFRPRALWLEHVAIETAGVVWVFAEVCILLLLISAVRHVSGTPTPTRFRLTREEKRRGAFVLGGLCVASTIVLLRHVFIVDPSDIVVVAEDGSSLVSGEFAAIYRNAVRGHLFVWMMFIGVWVLLEIAIVYQGLRLYRRLRVLLSVGGD